MPSPECVDGPSEAGFELVLCCWIVGDTKCECFEDSRVSGCMSNKVRKSLVWVVPDSTVCVLDASRVHWLRVV